MAGPLAGGKVEVLSLGSHAVYRSTGASGECTPYSSGLGLAEAREEVVQLSNGRTMASCGIDGVSTVGRKTEHSLEVQDTQMQP